MKFSLTWNFCGFPQNFMPPSFRDLKSLYILFHKKMGKNFAKLRNTNIADISFAKIFRDHSRTLELALEDPRCYHLPPVNGLFGAIGLSQC